MTILFEKDWKNEKGELVAIVDTNTTNTSFLKMSKLLRMLGIKNNKFMLSLYDSRLVGIDPHNLNSSNDPLGVKRAMVATECNRNFWYFIREVVRIQAAGGEPVQFRLHRANMASSWLFLNNIDLFLIQPRQTGKSIWACCAIAYIYAIAGINMNIGSLVHESDLLQDNVSRIKDIVESLPDYLYTKSPKDTYNKEGLRYDLLNNRFLPKIGSKEKAGATKIGRGGSFPKWWIDETAFIPNIDISYQNIAATMSEAAKVAKKNDKPYGMMLTTTAGDPTTPSAKYALDILNDAMKFTEKLYDTLNKEDLVTTIINNSRNSYAPMVNCTFSFLQLGYTKEWFAEQVERAKSKSDPDKICRDFLNMWKTSSDNPVIDKELMHKILINKQDEPTYVERIDEFMVSWYIPDTKSPEDYINKSFILGTDTSAQIGNDYTTNVAIDPEDLSVIFTFRCNDISSAKTIATIANLLLKYKKSIWIPERNNTGVVIVDSVIGILLKNGVNPFKRIYNKVINSRELDEFKSVDIEDMELANTSHRKYLGFNTTTGSRHLLFKNIMTPAAKLAFDKIKDPILINELAGLSKNNLGKIEHQIGKHDDMVIAWLLACYVILEGKNLYHYGLYKDQILQGVDLITGEHVDPELLEQQRSLKREIDKLSQLIKETNDYQIADNLKQRILSLSKLIIPEILQQDPMFIDNVNRNFDEFKEISMSTNKNNIGKFLGLNRSVY